MCFAWATCISACFPMGKFASRFFYSTTSASSAVIPQRCQHTFRTSALNDSSRETERHSLQTLSALVVSLLHFVDRTTSAPLSTSHRAQPRIFSSCLHCSPLAHEDIFTSLFPSAATSCLISVWSDQLISISPSPSPSPDDLSTSSAPLPSVFQRGNGLYGKSWRLIRARRMCDTPPRGRVMVSRT